MTNLFYKKNEEKSHSHSGFSIYELKTCCSNIPMIL